MCGRFAILVDYEYAKQQYLANRVYSFSVNYNVSPGQEVPVVRKEEGEVSVVPMRWGFIPHWAKDPSIGSRMINARAETVASKPSFRNAFKKRRCLIPAGGFYEWKGEKGHKQPYYITIPSGEPFISNSLRWLLPSAFITHTAQAPP